MQAGHDMPVSTWDAVLRASSQMVAEIELAPNDYTFRCTRCPQKKQRTKPKYLPWNKCYVLPQQSIFLTFQWNLEKKKVFLETYYASIFLEESLSLTKRHLQIIIMGLIRLELWMERFNPDIQMAWYPGAWSRYNYQWHLRYQTLGLNWISENCPRVQFQCSEPKSSKQCQYDTTFSSLKLKSFVAKKKSEKLDNSKPSSPTSERGLALERLESTMGSYSINCQYLVFHKNFEWNISTPILFGALNTA